MFNSCAVLFCNSGNATIVIRSLERERERERERESRNVTSSTRSVNKPGFAIAADAITFTSALIPNRPVRFLLDFNGETILHLFNFISSTKLTEKTVRGWRHLLTFSSKSEEKSNV